MKNIVLFFLFFSYGVCAQCDYNTLLNEGRNLYYKQQYRAALKKFNAARTCDPSKSVEVNKEVDRVFDAIEKQKEDAEKSKKALKEALVLSDSNLRIANRLLDYFNFNSENVAWAYKDGYYAIIDKSGNIITEYIYEVPGLFDRGLCITKRNGKYVFIDETGKELVNNIMFYIETDRNIYLAGSSWDLLFFNLKRNNSQRGYNVSEYNTLILTDDQIIPGRSTGGDTLLLSGKFAFLNKYSKFETFLREDARHPKYYEVYKGRFYESVKENLFFVVYQDDKVGMVNYRNDIILPCQYDRLSFDTDYIVTEFENNSGLADYSGKIFFDPRYRTVRKLGYSLFEVSDGVTVGIVDSSGNYIIKPAYIYSPGKIDTIVTFYPETYEERVQIVRHDPINFTLRSDKWLWIYDVSNHGFDVYNLAGVQILDDIEGFKFTPDYNYCIYRKGGKWGVVDPVGAIVFTPQFEKIENVGKDVFALKDSLSWKLTNENKTVIDSVVYDDIYLNIGVLGLKKDTIWSIYLIQKEQRLLVLWGSYFSYSSDTTISYDKETFEEKIVIVKNPNNITCYASNEKLFVALGFDKWAVLDKNGNVIIPALYDSIIGITDGIYLVCNDNLYGILNSAGDTIIPLMYPKITFGFDIYDKGHVYFSLHQYSENKKNNIPIREIIKGKTGLLNADNGNIEIPCIYDELKMMEDGIFMAMNLSEWEVIRMSNKATTLKSFDYVENMNYAGLYRTKKDGFYGIIDRNFNEILPAKYKEVRSFSDGLAAVQSGDLWGYIDTLGNFIIPLKFNGWRSEEFKNGYAVAEHNKLKGLINKKGEWVIYPKFEWIMDRFGNGLLWVIDTGGYHFVNMKGEPINNKRYESLEEVQGFYYPLNVLQYKGQYEVIDTNGIVRFVSKADRLKLFINGYAPCKKDSLWGFIDTLGNYTVIPQYRYVGYFNKRGFAPVWVDQKCGIIDTKGNFVIEPEYDGVSKYFHWYDQNLIVISEKDKGWGFVNFPGKIIIPPQFDEYKIWSDHYEVRQGKKWGLIDYTGNMVLNTDYSSVDFDSQDSTAILMNEHYRYGLFRANRIVIPVKYDDLDKLFKNIYRVKLNGKYGLYKGEKLILPIEYDDINISSEDVFLVKRYGAYGIISFSRSINVPPVYDAFGLLDEEYGWIRAKRNGKWGWIDKLGNVVIPFRYDIVTPFTNGKAYVRQSPYEKTFAINQKGQMILKIE